MRGQAPPLRICRTHPRPRPSVPSIPVSTSGLSSHSLPWPQRPLFCSDTSTPNIICSIPSRPLGLCPDPSTSSQHPAPLCPHPTATASPNVLRSLAPLSPHLQRPHLLHVLMDWMWFHSTALLAEGCLQQRPQPSPASLWLLPVAALPTASLALAVCAAWDWEDSKRGRSRNSNKAHALELPVLLLLEPCHGVKSRGQPAGEREDMQT